MINKKQILEKEEKTDIQQLTGSPSPTAVSDVAKGGKAQTLNEFDDAYHNFWAEQRDGDGMPGQACDPHEIEEAYAQLFESLSVIIRGKNT